jgi:hypothetical protein
VDLANLSPSGALVLGLYNGDLVGSGVTSVSLTVTGGPGSTVLLNDPNMSAALALTTFENGGHGNLVALGTTGTYPIKISLSVQTNAANSGFYGEFILGDPPSSTMQNLVLAKTDPPAALQQAALLTQYMSSWGGSGSAAPDISWLQPTQTPPKLILPSPLH